MPRKKKAEQPKPHTALGSIFARYRSSIADLREFFAQLYPIATDFDTARVEAQDEEQRQLVKSFVRGLGRERAQQLALELTELVDFLKKASGKPDKALEITPPAGQFLQLVTRLWMRRQRRLPHYELLNRGVLGCLVGSFEVLIANLAREHYRLHPGAVGNDDKFLSVNELRQFTSLDDAMDSVLSKRIDDLLRGSVDDWAKFFEKFDTATLRSLVPCWDQWCEIHQRRHLITHADGVVNRRYLTHVNWGNVVWPKDAPAVGTRLSVEGEYLALALDLFEAGGILLCQSTWKKLAPDETPVRLSSIGGLIDAVYDQVLNARWRVAEYVADWGRNDKSGEEGQRLVFTFNRWLAIKRQGRWAEIAEEVDRFDCSATHPRFELARASLRDRPDDFFRAGLVEASQLSADVLKEWPIFEEMRADPRFADAVAVAEAAPPAEQD